MSPARALSLLDDLSALLDVIPALLDVDCALNAKARASVTNLQVADRLSEPRRLTRCVAGFLPCAHGNVMSGEYAMRSFKDRRRQAALAGGDGGGAAAAAESAASPDSFPV